MKSAVRRGQGSRGGTYAPEETRRLLLQAATELIDERGYHATSVEAIVSAAGVTKGAFYYHFDGKEDVLHQIQDDYIDNRLRNCERVIASTSDPAEQLRELIYEAIVGIEKYRAQVSIFMQERRFLRDHDFVAIKEKRDLVDGFYFSVIQRGMEQGVFSSEASARIVSFSVLGMCAWASAWFKPGGPMTPREVADEMTALVLDGLKKAD
jgi:AcrR family transcriptional regulator